MDNNVDYNWYFHVWKNYGNFEGRASRKEYWNFVLFNFLVTLILALVSAGILSVIYVILVIVPSVAVAVRRLHDVGKSGWMLLAGLVPISYICFAWIAMMRVMNMTVRLLIFPMMIDLCSWSKCK